MLHRSTHITEKNSHKFSYDCFEIAEDNSEKVKEMKHLLRRAIRNELTDKQRYCLCEHYFKKRSMKDIAAELGVNPSTVTRHIQNATRRLKRVAEYYQ